MQPPELDRQAKINEFSWELGQQFLNKPARLLEHVIDPKWINAAAIEAAITHCQDRIAANMAQVCLEWEPPGQVEDQMHVWRTKCGQYRVARFGGPEPRFAVSTRVAAYNASETLIANDLHSLEVAFEAVEKWHTERSKKPLETNAAIRVEQAERLGLSSYLSEKTKTTKPESSIIREDKNLDLDSEILLVNNSGDIVMKTTENAVRKMLKACGFEADNKDKWPSERLRKKLSDKNEFDALIVKAKTNPEGEDAELLDKIGKALTDGGKVELAGGSAEKTKKPGKEKKPKGKNPDKPKKAEGEKVKKPKDKKDKPSRNGKAGGRVSGQGIALIDAAFQILTESKSEELNCVDMVKKIEAKGLWKRAGKTPEQSLASRIYVEMAKKGKEARFKKGKEKGTFALK